MIFSGVLEHDRGIKLVIGEAGAGWIPYILQRMDAEWEDQFKELGHLPAATRKKIVCDNAAKLYRFVN